MKAAAQFLGVLACIGAFIFIAALIAGAIS